MIVYVHVCTCILYCSTNVLLFSDIPAKACLKIALQQDPKLMLLVGTINRLAAQIDAYVHVYYDIVNWVGRRWKGREGERVRERGRERDSEEREREKESTLTYGWPGLAVPHCLLHLSSLR